MFLEHERGIRSSSSSCVFQQLLFFLAFPLPLFVCSDAVYVVAYDLCAARSDDTHTRTAKGHCCS